MCFYSQISFFSLPCSPLSEPLPHTENGLSNDKSTKDSAPGARLHTATEYRATKKERLSFYSGHKHTPPPVRRASSNPAELNTIQTNRRVEGRSIGMIAQFMMALFFTQYLFILTSYRPYAPVQECK